MGRILPRNDACDYCLDVMPSTLPTTGGILDHERHDGLEDDAIDGPVFGLLHLSFVRLATATHLRGDPGESAEEPAEERVGRIRGRLIRQRWT